MLNLDVTVQGIRDLHGNTMQSPVSWIAYMDKNQVVWQDDLLKYSILRGENLSFKSEFTIGAGHLKIQYFGSSFLVERQSKFWSDCA